MAITPSMSGFGNTSGGLTNLITCALGGVFVLGGCAVVSVSIQDPAISVLSIVTDTSGGSMAFSRFAAINVTGGRLELWATTATGALAGGSYLNVNLSGNALASATVDHFTGVVSLGANATASNTTANPSIAQVLQDANNYIVAGFLSLGSGVPVALTGSMRRTTTSSGASPVVSTITDNTAGSASSVTNAITLGATTWAAAILELRTVAAAGVSLEPTYSVEVELNGVGGGWTNLQADTLREFGIIIRHGISGSGPGDLVAGTGTAQFALNNSARNSAGAVGYYSLYHASKRSGWALGIGCRIRLQDPNTGTTYTRFVGRIDRIDPEPGLRLSRAVKVTAADWMDEAARWTIPPDIGEQVGKRGDEILSAILDEMPRQPTTTSFDMGVEAYPYALDTAAVQGQFALAEFAKLAASEFGLIYFKADGTLRYEGRHARLLDTTSDWTLSDADLSGLRLPSTRDEIINTVRVTLHPKLVDELPTTLVYDQVNAIEVASGVTKFLLGPYRDPVTGDPIGATEVQTQVAGTDYTANTAADGSGSDITSDFTIVVTIGPNGASFDVTNANAATGFLTTNRLYGRGIYDRGTLQFEAVDATSVDDVGTHAVNFDMPYQDDDDVGQGAADYILAKYSSAFAQARQITVPGRTTTILAQLLARDISDRLTIAETVTGLSSSFFINGVELTVLPSGHVSAVYTLAPAADPFAGVYWVLDSSVLGTNTVPAPF